MSMTLKTTKNMSCGLSVVFKIITRCSTIDVRKKSDLSRKNRTTGSPGHVQKIWDWPQPDYLYVKNQGMGASNLKLVPTSSTWKCNTFHNFLSMLEKKDFQKLAGLWLAGEVVNHIGIYGSKAAECLSVFQRQSCCILLGLETNWLYEGTWGLGFCHWGNNTIVTMEGQQSWRV